MKKQTIVTLGGGGGSFVVLRGLTKLNNPENNKAIYGPWDNGSRSGQIRLKYGVVPPGDYFMCLYGLMEDEDQVQEAFALLNDRSEETLLRDILAVRAERKHHGIEAGNDALRRLLRVRGDLIPVSDVDLNLFAETKKGEIIFGETNIDRRDEDPNFDPEDVTSTIFFDVTAKATKKAIDAILEADKIIIVPGSPYTSIFPHLLVKGISEAITKSKAKLIVIPNLTTARGEDHHLNKVEFWLQEFQFLLSGKSKTTGSEKSRIDYIILNDAQIPEEIVQTYIDKSQYVVQIDTSQVQLIANGAKIFETDLLDKDELSRKLIRHDSRLIAQAILQL